MKKLITLLVLSGFAGVASAASINWDINMGRNGKIVDTNGDPMNTAIYLILDTSVSDLETAVTENNFETALTSAKLGQATLSSGKLTGTQTASSDKLTANTYYNFALVVYDTANAQYYVSDSIRQQAYDAGAEVVTPKSVSFGTDHVGSTYSGANFSPTTTVPEPSVAIMGLLGLGMLLKRRRA